MISRNSSTWLGSRACLSLKWRQNVQRPLDARSRAPCPVTAREATTAAGSTNKEERGQPGAQSATPSAEQHLKILSEKLDLTADQQRKIRPILQQMFESRQKIIQDNSLSSQAREEKEKAL